MTVLYLVNRGPESMKITFVLHVIWSLCSLALCFAWSPPFLFRTGLLSFTNKNLPFPLVIVFDLRKKHANVITIREN